MKRNWLGQWRAGSRVNFPACRTVPESASVGRCLSRGRLCPPSRPPTNWRPMSWHRDWRRACRSMARSLRITAGRARWSRRRNFACVSNFWTHSRRRWRPMYGRHIRTIHPSGLWSAPNMLEKNTCHGHRRFLHPRPFNSLTSSISKSCLSTKASRVPRVS